MPGVGRVADSSKGLMVNGRPLDAFTMGSRREYRDRDEVEVQVLDSLVDRSETGLTVFELRSRVDVDIESLETALHSLHEDGLITVDDTGDRSVIRPEEHVLPESSSETTNEGFSDWIVRRLRELLDR